MLLFVRIPDIVKVEQKASLGEIVGSIKGGVSFLKTNQGILVLLLMYSVLEFMGAVSFDNMYSPLILARTGNNEMTVGIISAFMAAGCLVASIKRSQYRFDICCCWSYWYDCSCNFMP